MKINFKLISVFALCAALGLGCKKSYLDTNPSNAAGQEEIFQTTQGAYLALNGIHAFLISMNLFDGIHSNWGLKAQDLESDMMGNDMVGTGSGYDWFQPYYNYTATASSTYYFCDFAWTFYYRIINNANAIIDHIDAAKGPQDEKDDIKGQALAYRAFAYFRLCQDFQQTYIGNQNKPGVPIYKHETDGTFKGNARGTLQEDYDFIRSDIEESISLLKNAPAHSSISNISWAVANGIAARIYSVTDQWDSVISKTNNAISVYPQIMSAADYASGFNSASNVEWMWGSTWTAEQYNNLGILCFISFMDPSCPGYASVGATRAMTSKLYDTISVTDVRRSLFDSTGNHLQHKFRTQDPSGFVCDYEYMRSSEMYLLRAEAEAHNNDLTDAVTDLNAVIQKRDPNYDANNYATNGTSLLTQIYLQRRIELWGEGFGRLDIMRLGETLKRPTTLADGPGNHNPAVCQYTDEPVGWSRFIYPIPQGEIDNNPNINAGDQNP